MMIFDDSPLGKDFHLKKDVMVGQSLVNGCQHHLSHLCCDTMMMRIVLMVRRRLIRMMMMLMRTLR